MCIYVSMHGIVIIEIYSYNKRVNTLYTVVVSPSYILPKCAKTREPKDEHYASWGTHISYNICNPIPLDSLKNHTPLPYITCGLTGIPKIGERNPKIKIFTRQVSRISKLKRESPCK